MKLALLLTLSALLAACAPTPPPVAATPPAAAASSCAAPGAVEKVCRRQVERCVTPYADAGKQCTDNSQCAGDCLLDGDPKPEGNVGACQKDDNPCGCRSPLVAGKVFKAICVD